MLCELQIQNFKKSQKHQLFVNVTQSNPRASKRKTSKPVSPTHDNGVGEKQGKDQEQRGAKQSFYSLHQVCTTRQGTRYTSQRYEQQWLVGPASCQGAMSCLPLCKRVMANESKHR